MQLDVTARRAGEGVQALLRRLASLVGGLVVVAVLISLATFATGMWVFDSSTAWIVLGGIVCLVPVGAALIGWLLVHGAAKYTPRLISDINTFLKSPSPSAQVLIDYDTGQPIAASAKSFGSLQTDLETRKADLPALYIGVRAITKVPALAAITVLGMLGVGALGTILLLGGLID